MTQEESDLVTRLLTEIKALRSSRDLIFEQIKERHEMIENLLRVEKKSN